MSNQELLDLLQVETRVLLQPLVVLFDIGNEHTIVPPADRVRLLMGNRGSQLNLVNDLIERLLLVIILF